MKMLGCECGPLTKFLVLVIGLTVVTGTSLNISQHKNANKNTSFDDTLNNQTFILPVTIYYETLCSDSMVFITHQLYPSWLRRDKDMKLELVPFGKSWIEQRDGEEPVYHCQHGVRECQLNIMHGCILEKLSMNQAFPVIACLMKNFRTSFDNCMENHADKKQSIVDCSQGQLGAQLYERFANQTDAVHRPLPFVPTIVGDEPYNYYEQDEWLHHFDRKFVQRHEEKYGRKL